MTMKLHIILLSKRNASMNQTFFYIFALLFSVSQSFAQDKSEFQKKEFIDAKGDTLRYRILFPKNYDKTKKYPLVLFLHGAGERGRDNEKQLTHGSKLFLKDEYREKYPAIFLAPQCPENQYWASVKIDRGKMPLALDFNYENDITHPLHAALELTKTLIKNERVDKHRIYIMGLSMGGMGTFEAVYRQPKLFAAAIPICGGADAKAYTKKAAKVPFWLFHGDKDGVVEVRYSREMYARLQELKSDVKYTECTGVNHNSWDNAFAEPALFEWLFSKKK